MAAAAAVAWLALLALGPSTASLSADYFTAPEILDNNRHPKTFTIKSGNIISTGHFRGVLKQGTKKVCNGMSCYSMPQTKVKSRGWSDIFLSMYNSSRVLQWTATAGGDGDDKARAVNCNIDGNILLTGYITGLRAKFSGLTLSSRSTLSRTIFLAQYSQSGAIQTVNEAASCGIGLCDVTAVTSDETGTILTGIFTDKITFGLKEECTTTTPKQCIMVPVATLGTEVGIDFEAVLKSTGSGTSRPKHCWVAKYNKKGEYLWHNYCFDETFIQDEALAPQFRTNSYEQAEWAKKAQKFFVLDPKDDTGLLGKDFDYESYAARRVPFGV